MRAYRAERAVTIALVPLYEFECGRCGARFEELVAAGTEAVACRECGAEGTRRVYSAPAPEPRIVKTGGALRTQEARNAELRARTRRDFKAARRRTEMRRKGTS
jgi:putative FmdB family regulatory protein